MSSNVEVKKDETVEEKKVEEQKVEEQPKKKPLRQRLEEQWQLILKCFEVLLCAACVGVAYEPFSEIGIGKVQLHHVAVLYTASTGYILIELIMIAARLMGDKISCKTNAIFATIAAALFFVTGILVAKDKSDNSNKLFHAQFYLLQMLVATSAFSFINCGVFIVEAALTLWKKIDF